MMQEMQVWSLGQEDPLEKEMETHSSIFAWKISWTEEPGGLPFMGLQRVGHDWLSAHTCTHTHNYTHVYPNCLTSSGIKSLMCLQRKSQHHLQQAGKQWQRSLHDYSHIPHDSHHPRSLTKPSVFSDSVSLYKHGQNVSLHGIFLHGNFLRYDVVSGDILRRWRQWVSYEQAKVSWGSLKQCFSNFKGVHITWGLC